MEHHFKSRYKTFLGIIMPVLGIIFVSFIFFSISIFLLKELAGMEDFLVTVISVLISVLTVIFLIYRIVNSPDYIVTDKEVIIRNRKKEILRAAYEGNYMSSYVVKHSYNGIPTATMRHLVIDDGKKEKKYLCALKKKHFDEFMSLILAYSNKGAEGIINDSQNNNIVNNVNKEFFIDKNKILSRIALAKSGIFIILLVFLVIIMVVFSMDDVSINYLYIFIPIILAACIIRIFISVNLVKRKTPEKVSIRVNKIILDENEYNYTEISRLILTPPSYYTGNINRVLKIITNDGMSKTFNLGFKVSKAGKTDKIFPEYEEFCYLLEGMFLNTPGKFQYDL